MDEDQENIVSLSETEEVVSFADGLAQEENEAVLNDAEGTLKKERLRGGMDLYADLSDFYEQDFFHRKPQPTPCPRSL